MVESVRAFVQKKEVNGVSGVMIYLIRNIGDLIAFRSLKTFLFFPMQILEIDAL
ncbi:hypothetical protein CANDROIZ_270007 [Candidatus Roizmanbacteria bacterium]|nr:hypothetical protein CANDROIZ_270007 [Candidatus Roizmanbacteria bacterium]